MFWQWPSKDKGRYPRKQNSTHKQPLLSYLSRSIHNWRMWDAVLPPANILLWGCLHRLSGHDPGGGHSSAWSTGAITEPSEPSLHVSLVSSFKYSVSPSCLHSELNSGSTEGQTSEWVTPNPVPAPCCSSGARHAREIQILAVALLVCILPMYPEECL